MLEGKVEGILKKYGTEPRPIFEKPQWSIEAFHPIDVKMVERNDSWYCGMKSDNFVVIAGWNEEDYDLYSIMVIANHKGELKYSTATFYGTDVAYLE